MWWPHWFGLLLFFTICLSKWLCLPVWFSVLLSVLLVGKQIKNERRSEPFQDHRYTCSWRLHTISHRLTGHFISVVPLFWLYLCQMIPFLLWLYQALLLDCPNTKFHNISAPKPARRWPQETHAWLLRDNRHDPVYQIWSDWLHLDTISCLPQGFFCGDKHHVQKASWKGKELFGLNFHITCYPW